MTDYPVFAAGKSDVGLVRERNEDSLYLNTPMGLWLVADGMGGHENGALASRTAVSGFKALVVGEDFEEAVAKVAGRVHQINARLAKIARERGISRMGTTAVALLLRQRRFAAIWVGDSRAYVWRRGGLFQLSVDHTHVQDLIDQGILSPADAKGHPMSHVLTRALGVEDVVQVDIVQDEVEPGDRFLLCSDGLTGPVSEHDIRELIAIGDPQAAVDALVAQARENGAPDNVTAIVVEVGGPAHD